MITSFSQDGLRESYYLATARGSSSLFLIEAPVDDILLLYRAEALFVDFGLLSRMGAMEPSVQGRRWDTVLFSRILLGTKTFLNVGYSQLNKLFPDSNHVKFGLDVDELCSAESCDVPNGGVVPGFHCGADSIAGSSRIYPQF